ncbi:MAG: DUF4397 domain-containing protein [Ferruginibacter sp.]
MKKIFLYTSLAALLFIVNSCEKDTVYRAERTFTNPGTALLKINYASAYATNPSVQLSINDVRVSGLIAGRTPFPGGGYNTNGSSFGDYLSLTPGTNVLSISIPKKNTNVDSVLLYKTTLTLEANKNYTVHVADTFARTKSLLVTDNLNFPDVNTSRFKFVNLIPNAPLVDLYYGTTKVASAIPYLGSSAEFTLPATPAIIASWAIRETGTSPTSTALATYISSNTLLNQRVYTVFSMGYKSGTGVLLPFVSFFLNK